MQLGTRGREGRAGEEKLLVAAATLWRERSTGVFVSILRVSKARKAAPWLLGSTPRRRWTSTTVSRLRIV